MRQVGALFFFALAKNKSEHTFLNTSCMCMEKLFAQIENLLEIKKRKLHHNLLFAKISLHWRFLCSHRRRWNVFVLYACAFHIKSVERCALSWRLYFSWYTYICKIYRSSFSTLSKFYKLFAAQRIIRRAQRNINDNKLYLRWKDDDKNVKTYDYFTHRHWE